MTIVLVAMHMAANIDWSVTFGLVTFSFSKSAFPVSIHIVPYEFLTLHKF
jgi:hypothetical protein